MIEDGSSSASSLLPVEAERREETRLGRAERMRVVKQVAADVRASDDAIAGQPGQATRSISSGRKVTTTGNGSATSTSNATPSP